MPRNDELHGSRGAWHTIVMRPVTTAREVIRQSDAEKRFMGDEEGDRQYRRLGDTAKCPACGWRMDAEAYRCPKCYIYFCFKCRARVTEREPQFQCANQSCSCYGKLLCAACTVMVPEFKDVTRITTHAHTIKVGDNWGFAALVVPIMVGTTLWGSNSFLAGLTGTVVAFFVVTGLLFYFGSTWFKRDKLIPQTVVTSNEKVAEHRCCIQCKRPAKTLR
jgi:hypothetical protein